MGSWHASGSILDRLRDLEPRIRSVMQITGIPGCSVGVIHRGVEVWKFNAGFRDVERSLPPQPDTVFNLNSLTKSLTAACFACLVREGVVSWDTPISSILPDFGRDEIDDKITPIDLLSMRTGHQSLNCMAWQGSNIVLPDIEDTLQFWNAMPRLGRFRSHFSYNDWCYGVMALVIEELSGQPFHTFLQERIFDPLDLKRTKMEDGIPFENTAASYATLGDRSPTRVPDPTIGVGTFTQGSSGVISTIDDMLRLYHKYLQAICHQSQSLKSTTPNNPFVECNVLLAPHNPLSPNGLGPSKHAYACGWVRSHLPGPLGTIGTNADYLDEDMPYILEGSPCRLCIYHTGLMAGSSSNIALLPESDTVIAILANASPLGDGTDWISQMIIEAIFDPPFKHDYEKIADEVACEVLNHMPSVGRQLESRRVPNTVPSFTPESYVGTFKHDITPFTIDIKLNKGQLSLIFNRQLMETYPLRHYHHDTFSWWMPFNDASQRGRFLMCYIPDTFLINFEDDANRLTWLSGDIGDEPYTFIRIG